MSTKREKQESKRPQKRGRQREMCAHGKTLVNGDRGGKLREHQKQNSISTPFSSKP